NLASVLDIFLLRQFFRTLPRELEEAALLDGAGRMQIFWRVVVPLSKPVLAVVTITSFIFHWNDLLWPLVVLNDKALYTLPVAVAGPPAVLGSADYPYYRDDRGVWADRLRSLRDELRIGVVSAYVPWRHHQPDADRAPDFTGAGDPSRDVVGFVAHCHRLGLG